ncbi:MAG: InlB B-repeat-containing protein [Bacilli bacterium]|nr:InlB B-repeat-containing protein [Bacilli bacterium]
MNKKGFTLIEVLAVITIIGLLTAIAIPSSQGIAKKINEKSYQTKIKLATEGAKIWGEDNATCFTCVEGSCPVACENLECIYKSNDEKICQITIGTLAKNNYFKYDKIVEGEKIVLNPKNKSQTLNNEKVTIIYYVKNKVVNIYMGNYLYTLSFDGNGATGAMDSIKCVNNHQCSIPDNIFERINYDFAGWALAPSDSVKYNNLDSLKLTADTTLYAKWNLKKYILSFNGNGSTSGTMAPIKCEHDVACTISNNGFVKTGFKFIGWSTTPGGQVLYNNLSSISLTKNTTLYAIWQDATPPTILITNTKPLLPGTDIYSSPVSIKISANDNSGVKSIKYCTTTSSTCTPTYSISNGGNISVTGRTTTTLGNTVCSIATDNLNNTTATPICKTYKIDNRNPNITCSSTGTWSKTSSTINCTGTDYFGIRKLEWSIDNNNWNTFSNINGSGPFSTPYNANFNTSKYNNYVRVTDTAGRTYTTNTYSKIDNLIPFPPAFDIYGTINDTNSNIRAVNCTNNKYLADGSSNPDYNKNINTICRLTYIYYRQGYTWSWYWEDDWNADNGYSGVQYLTYNGSCSSTYYTGGNVPCLSIGTGRYVDFYAVDAAGNKSSTFLRIYAP